MAPGVGSAEGGSEKKQRIRPKAKDVKEQGLRRRPRRPPREGHSKGLADQLEDPNEYGVRVSVRNPVVLPAVMHTREHPLGPAVLFVAL